MDQAQVQTELAKVQASCVEPKAQLEERFNECLRALVNRHGGSSIDRLSLRLIETITNDVALLLGAETSDMRQAVGITQLLAERGER